MKYTLIKFLAVSVGFLNLASVWAASQEVATFIVQGVVSDADGFPISESFLVPISDGESIFRARKALASEPGEDGWEHLGIVATIELSADGSNRNYSIPGRMAWSWRVKDFIQFHNGILARMSLPRFDDSPSVIEVDPESWISTNGNLISFANFRVVAELSESGETELINVSTRGFVGNGEQTLIAGFIIPAGATKTVLLRGLGPSLAAHGVEDYLVDPRITLYKGPTRVAENDNWKEGQSLEPFNFISERFLPNHDEEAALLITLTPGIYTIHLTSAFKPQQTGIGLVEVFDMDERL